MPLTLDQAYDLLQSARERDRMGHAFLITGAAGSGKRELASRIITMLQPKAQAEEANLFGESPPITEQKHPELETLQSEFVRIVKPRSKSRQIKVEDMRDLEDSFYMSAPPNQWKIGVIIDADRMNDNAANAFLKTLEEPPSQSLLLLITSSPDRLLPTILSRCISLSLYSNGEYVVNEQEHFVANLLQKALTQPSLSISLALSIKSEFELYLKRQKEELATKHKTALKEETNQLKSTVEKEYLKAKEEEAKALEASEYQAARADSVNALINWMGDAVRVKVGTSPKIFSQSTDTLTEFTNTMEVEDLLTRLTTLEDLRTLLVETNVHEALSLEVHFMNAFV